jgi:hypothetical protein
LTGLKPGQASDVLTDRFGFEALVLLERSEAKVLPPAQAYPLVEEALLERKLKSAFEAWLSGALAKADIQVSEHLLESAEKGGDGEVQEPDSVIPEPDDQAGSETMEAPEPQDGMDGGEPADEAIPMDQIGTDTGI